MCVSILSETLQHEKLQIAWTLYFAMKGTDFLDYDSGRISETLSSAFMEAKENVAASPSQGEAMATYLVFLVTSY